MKKDHTNWLPSWKILVFYSFILINFCVSLKWNSQVNELSKVICQNFVLPKLSIWCECRRRKLTQFTVLNANVRRRRSSEVTNGVSISNIYSKTFGPHQWSKFLKRQPRILIQTHPRNPLFWRTSCDRGHFVLVVTGNDTKEKFWKKFQLFFSVRPIVWIIIRKNPLLRALEIACLETFFNVWIVFFLLITCFQENGMNKKF